MNSPSAAVFILAQNLKKIKNIAFQFSWEIYCANKKKILFLCIWFFFTWLNTALLKFKQKQLWNFDSVSVYLQKPVQDLYLVVVFSAVSWLYK